MKIKNGFTLRSIGDTYVLIGDGIEQVNFNKLISFNASAAYLWIEIMNKEFTLDTLSNLLLKKYDITTEQALTDCKAIVDEWIKAELIEQ